MAAAPPSAAPVSQVVQPRLDARHSEPGDVERPLLLRELLHGIHRPHGTFDHGQQEGPIGTVRLQELVERVSDDCVFVFSVKNRLEGDVHQDGRRRTQLSRHEGQHADFVGRVEFASGLLQLGVPRAARDHEQRQFLPCGFTLFGLITNRRCFQTMSFQVCDVRTSSATLAGPTFPSATFTQ